VQRPELFRLLLLSPFHGHLLVVFYAPRVPNFVALLRGINVGKHRRVAMADVRSLLTDAGYAGVRTHLQSGNVLFAGPARQPRAVERSVEEALRSGLGIEIDVMVRTPSELANVLSVNPFLARGEDPATLYVSFLKSRPGADSAAALDGVGFDPDEFALQGRELYLRYPGGLGRSKMTAAFFERALGVPGTVRRWSVVTKLAELVEAP
jgi:uncharacterized protein (DUF1697 family)